MWGILKASSSALKAAALVRQWYQIRHHRNYSSTEIRLGLAHGRLLRNELLMRPKLPSIRSSLLRMHDTILKVADQRYYIDDTPVLSEFEKLVILLEDRRFFRHYGVDWRSVARELFRMISGQRHGGASTIDMQLFRTASGRYEKTVRRKVREFIGVFALQRKFTKIELLRIYLNVAYFGTGLSGVLEGAKAMFPNRFDEFDWRFDPARLSLQECAELASLLVYPKPRVAKLDWEAKVRRRAHYGLSLYARRDQDLDKVLR